MNDGKERGSASNGDEKGGRVRRVVAQDRDRLANLKTPPEKHFTLESEYTGWIQPSFYTSLWLGTDENLRYCMGKAISAHTLAHWQYHVNVCVNNYLHKNGAVSPSRVLRRQTWSDGMRNEFANRILATMSLRRKYSAFLHKAQCSWDGAKYIGVSGLREFSPLFLSQTLMDDIHRIFGQLTQELRGVQYLASCQSLTTPFHDLFRIVKETIVHMHENLSVESRCLLIILRLLLSISMAGKEINIILRLATSC